MGNNPVGGFGEYHYPPPPAAPKVDPASLKKAENVVAAGCKGVTANVRDNGQKDSFYIGNPDGYAVNLVGPDNSITNYQIRPSGEIVLATEIHRPGRSRDEISPSVTPDTDAVQSFISGLNAGNVAEQQGCQK